MRKVWVYPTSTLLVLSLLLLSSPPIMSVGAKQISNEPVRIEVSSWGPSQETIAATQTALLNQASVREYIKGPRRRIISFELVDNDDKSLPATPPPTAYRAIAYDYESNRALSVEGIFGNSTVQTRLLTEQPSVFNQEEFDEAVKILSDDRTYGALLKQGKVKAYQPMPPVLENTKERTILVGLRSPVAQPSPEIVGINLTRKTVLRFAGGSPKSSSSAPTACGSPSAGQSTTSRGTAGQFQVQVTQGATTIWSFLAIRPAASSGTRGSGVELRDVTYRGKMVLRRAHAPILNVQYEGDACGPFRDWQWQEGSLVSSGTTVTPGFNVCQSPCATPPQTILDNGTDTGNFLGVGGYVDGTKAIFVSEMQAGWYRYVSKWEFNVDGTILPIFGFGGVTNSCICNAHNHHVYWRFDFDIETSANNFVTGPGLRSWPHAISSEIKLTRSATPENNTLYVKNQATGATYQIVQGEDDGIADTYARGDVWILAFRSTELDDGHNSTGSATEADWDQFVTGEAVDNSDIVVIYRAGFRHIEAARRDPAHLSEAHIVGPTFKAINGY